jgi:DNA (cytosine-5)-methyltransferase 1
MQLAKTPTVSLFSGCGGMDIGAERAGCHVVYANEIDRDAAETLKKTIGAESVDCADIADVNSFPDADLVIGGYPCQSFSMGGNRDPAKDARTHLYHHFGRCLSIVQPRFFVAENVSGLQKLRNGRFLQDQVALFEKCGPSGYHISAQVLNARDYGIPQVRKRLFIVGVRKDLKKVFVFPPETHGKANKRRPLLLPYASHGDAIRHLPIWPDGEFYERPHDPEGHMSWYYMSRNRKADWDEPSYTIVANWRHVTLHPASFTMTLTWSNLADGWKQRWDFSGKYEHLEADPSRPLLEVPRRLSWRECAAIQTFPNDFEPVGKVESKFTQIGNAVPPKLAEVLLTHLLGGKGLCNVSTAKKAVQAAAATQMSFWE